MKEGYKWCYWITPAKFRSGIYDKEYFDSAIDIPFEDTSLLGSSHIKEYLSYHVAKEKIGCTKPTYTKGIKISDTDNSFNNTIIYEYYNTKRQNG